MSRIIADRGNSWVYPENSEKAIRSVYENHLVSPYSDFDGAFVDVRLTRDNKLVLCKSHNLLHLSNGAGKVSCYTLEELKRYQCCFYKWDLYKYYAFLKFYKKDEATDYLLKKLKGMQFNYDQFIGLEEALSYVKGQKEMILNVCKDELYRSEYLAEIIRVSHLYSDKDIKLLVPDEATFCKIKNIDPFLQVGVRINGSSPRQLNYEHNFEVCSVYELEHDCFLLDHCLNWLSESKMLYIDSMVLLKDILSYFEMFKYNGSYPHVITPNPELFRSVLQRTYYNGYVAYREIQKKEFVVKYKGKK